LTPQNTGVIVKAHQMFVRVETPDVLGLFSGRIAQNSQVKLKNNMQKGIIRMITREVEADIRKLIAGDRLVGSRPLIVGKPSQILSQCGADPNLYITITKKVVDKAMRPEIRDKSGRMVGNTGHGLTEELVIKAVYNLESPVMILRGRRERALLIITNIVDQKERYIVIAIELDRQEGFTKVNSIRSLYGRDNLACFIDDNIEKGHLLAANKEKADKMLRSIGKSYPEENTFISF
jgi:hypothetical protein